MADNRKYISIINKEGNDIYIKDVEARQSIANKADNTTFGGSGSGHSSGLVPDPGATQGNTKFLREDGTWQIPSGGIAYESKNAESGGVEVSLVTTGEKYIWNNKQDIISDLSTIRNGASAGATAYQKPQGGIPASDISTGVIPTTLPANGGNAATVNNHSVNVDVPSNAVFTDTTYSVMGASGSTHASGLVPDTPATAGTSKYLREDGTWQIPEGGNSTIDYTTIDSDVADINASVAANALLKTAQTLTTSEKAQVKTNLGIELAGTATGSIIAQSNTNYTTAQVRNIVLSTSEPTSSDGSNGDIWIVYEA